jgi:hypothetical protein
MKMEAAVSSKVLVALYQFTHLSLHRKLNSKQPRNVCRVVVGDLTRLSVNRILGWILERWDGVMWTGLVWLRIGTGGEIL